MVASEEIAAMAIDCTPRTAWLTIANNWTFESKTSVATASYSSFANSVEIIIETMMY